MHFQPTPLTTLATGCVSPQVGPWFQSLEQDRRAREAYDRSAAQTGGYAPGDGPDRQLDLRRWHSLEESDGNLFGRMHVLYCQKRGASVG